MSEDSQMPRPKLVAPDGSRLETGTAPPPQKHAETPERIEPSAKRSTELDGAPKAPKPKLTSCPLCGRSVSSVARACPHCGHIVSAAAREVSVIDIQMPFWSMVNFMIRWALASIPAIITLAVIASGVLLLFGAFGKIMHG